MIIQFFFLLISYCIGAIPTGWLIAHVAGVPDITKYGSGNIGATNVGRLLGLPYFALVLLIDSLKAYLFVQSLHAWYGITYYTVSAALLLLIGNGISFFLHGKGGKGIATSIGILLALQPYVLSYLFIVWLFAASFTKKMGIACVSALVFLPFMSWYFYYNTMLLVLSLFIFAWGVWRHEKNIRQYFILGKIPL